MFSLASQCGDFDMYSKHILILGGTFAPGMYQNKLFTARNTTIRDCSRYHNDGLNIFKQGQNEPLTFKQVQNYLLR